MHHINEIGSKPPNLLSVLLTWFLNQCIYLNLEIYSDSGDEYLLKFYVQLNSVKSVPRTLFYLEIFLVFLKISSHSCGD